MNRLSIPVALALLFAVAEVPALAITWGELDTAHTSVGAMVVDWPGYGLLQYCSGTLIHPRVFLTAGHCTNAWEGAGPGTVWVNLDQYALNEATLLPVEQVITHPDYYWGPTSNVHEVGVLILAQPVEGIAPARLPEEGLLDGLREQGLLGHGSDKAKFTVVGYGGSLNWPPPERYYDDLRQVAQSEFRALLKAQLFLSQNQAAGDAGTCYGDSGGPVFWTEEDGTEILVGITSWGDASCVAAGFNYRADIPETLTFIQSVVDSLD